MYDILKPWFPLVAILLIDFTFKELGRSLSFYHAYGNLTPRVLLATHGLIVILAAFKWKKAFSLEASRPLVAVLIGLISLALAQAIYHWVMFEWGLHTPLEQGIGWELARKTPLILSAVVTSWALLSAAKVPPKFCALTLATSLCLAIIFENFRVPVSAPTGITGSMALLMSFALWLTIGSALAHLLIARDTNWRWIALGWLAIAGSSCLYHLPAGIWNYVPLLSFDLIGIYVIGEGFRRWNPEKTSYPTEKIRKAS